MPGACLLRRRKKVEKEALKVAIFLICQLALFDSSIIHISYLLPEVCSASSAARYSLILY